MTTEQERYTLDQTSYEALPMGEYRARLTSITMEQSAFTDDDGRPKQQFVMFFEITDERITPDGEPIAGRQLRAWANPSFGRGSKLFAWTAALLGRPIAPGEPFDSAAIIGRPCVLAVLRKEGDKGPYNKIDSITADAIAAPAPGLAGAMAVATPQPLALGAGA